VPLRVTTSHLTHGAVLPRKRRAAHHSYCLWNKPVLRPPVESGQYNSAQFAALADDCVITLSVGRTGQCWDALAESFFASLKGECLNRRPWPTRAAVRRAIVDYIAWFNGARLHSALAYLTVNEFETAASKQALANVA
jgi:putative transposase